MTEEAFAQTRKSDWDRYVELLKSRSWAGKDALEFPGLYRKICQDLNQAKAEVYSPDLTDRLNQLVWEGHQRLYKHHGASALPWIRMLFVEFPQSVRSHGKLVGGSIAAFYAVAVLTFVYGLFWPMNLGWVLDENQRQSLSQMYHPGAEHFLKPREVQSSVDMFAYYIQHNISIGFQTLAGGVLGGLGSLFFLGYNALIFGASAAWILRWGDELTFFPFVVTHAAFELTAIVLLGACGWKMGWSLISPGPKKRIKAFTEASAQVRSLLWGSVMFLVLAAGIEAFWSSLVLEPVFKFVSGAATWSLVAAFFLFGGRNRVRNA